MKITRVLAVISFALLLALGCNRGESSHAGANEPPSREFDADLRRDLRSYFQGSAVAYELLRNEPAKRGIAHPNYYAWVRATAPDGAVREGAVRLTAVDRTHFEVSDFVTVDAIRANPDALEQIFPAPLCPGIRDRAQAH
jgi:hypothetical protein